MNDTEGHVDILVCMAGTGGTGFGTASYLRSRNPNLQVVLVQPHPDSRLTPEHPDAQIIDGVLPAYDVPESALSDYLRPDWSDACINVRTEEAYETAHEVLRAVWAHRQQRLCTQRCRWAADRRIRERTSWSSSRTTA